MMRSTGKIIFNIMEIHMQELIDALIFVCSLGIMLCCLYLAEIIIMTFIPPPDNSSSIETKEKEKKDNSSFLKIT